MYFYYYYIQHDLFKKCSHKSKFLGLYLLSSPKPQLDKLYLSIHAISYSNSNVRVLKNAYYFFSISTMKTEKNKIKKIK